MMRVYIYDNKKDTDDKNKCTDTKLEKVEKLMDKFFNTLSNKVEIGKPHYYITMVHTNSKFPLLYGGHC